MIEYVNVVVIRDGVVHDNDLFAGEHDEITKLAGIHYLAQCQKYSNVNKMSLDDMTASLDDGYYEFHGGSVCISWPALPPLSCAECGELMKIEDNGVSHHIDCDGNVDHDKDADHVALSEALYGSI